MIRKLTIQEIRLERAAPFLLPLLLFWLILLVSIPDSFTQYFHTYSLGLFLIVIILYYISFSLPEKIGSVVALSLTMALLALSLSYIWTSGFSDNFVIGGLLPYKDSKNYYAGATLLLNGLPMLKAGQATERPLFPSFLASLFWLTGQNLKISLGIIVQLVGIGIYFSTQQIRKAFGVLAASIFATLLYFYIQSFIGFTLSELLGFLTACLGFAMILEASIHHKWGDLLLGIAILLIGVSARAGAFFIFPMLALWIGWIFRGERAFDLRRAVYSFIFILALYFLINSVYSRLLGIPPGSSFGNFSYAMYGQVRGGTGWHSAIEELGTRDPRIVYRAALDYFLDHPIGLAIGFAKSYRDFFWFDGSGIFPFSRSAWLPSLNIILWLGTLILLLKAIIQLFKGIQAERDSLLLACFIGIFLSIPFLPPIDGGTRFHAATVPFFFAALVAGLSGFPKGRQEQIRGENPRSGSLVIYRSAIISLIVIVLILPILLYEFGRKPVHTAADCSQNEQPFVIESHPGSYIDFMKDHSLRKAFTSEVSLDDFQNNNIELTVDDYYQKLFSLAKRDSANIRLIPTINLIDNNFHYFYIPLDKLPHRGLSDLIAGCGIEIRTKNQSIFQVKSVSSKDQ